MARHKALQVKTHGSHELQVAVINRLKGWGYKGWGLDSGGLVFIPETGNWNRSDQHDVERLTVDEFMQNEYWPQWRYGESLQPGERFIVRQHWRDEPDVEFVVVKPFVMDHQSAATGPVVAYSTDFNELMTVKPKDTYRICGWESATRDS